MSSTWDVEMAKQFRQRDNVEPFGVILGDVISLNPLKVSIYNDNVILIEGKKCYVCSNLINNYIRKANIKLDSVADHGTISTSGEISYSDILKVGDKIVCLPTTDGQTFFIIDKVVV